MKSLIRQYSSFRAALVIIREKRTFNHTATHAYNIFEFRIIIIEYGKAFG